MSRPIAVTLLAIALLGFSLWMPAHAGMRGGGHRTGGFLIAAVVMAAAGLVAAEALWSLRPHAFLAFMVWSVCAMVAVVLGRLGAPGPTHTARLVRDVVYMGLAIGLVAIYLRRAV